MMYLLIHVGRSPLRLVRYAMLCYATLCDAMRCYGMLWDAMRCYGRDRMARLEIRIGPVLSCPVVQTLFICEGVRAKYRSIGEERVEYV